jgi:hypothetical protein
MKHQGPQRDGSPPLPLGEGGGEGAMPIGVATSHILDRVPPLTLSLSPWERGPDAPFATNSYH